MKGEPHVSYRARHNRAYRRPKSAKIVRRHDATCEGKHLHPNQVTALASAVSNLARHQSEAGPWRLFAYQCVACRGWHLTKNEALNEGAAYATADVTVWP